MKHLKWFYNNILPYILAVLPFLFMDLMIRGLATQVNYFRAEMVASSWLFSVVWIALIVLVTTSLRRKIGRIVYLCLFVIYFLLFLTNCVYFSYTDFFFSFNLLSLAGAGSDYILDTVLGTDPLIYLGALGIIGCFVAAFWLFPRRDKWNPYLLGGTVAAFLLVHSLIPMLYGEAYDSLKWDAWRNPRNVYENFNDSNKCIKICGLYEYSFRDFYKTFLSPSPKMTAEEKQILDKVTDSEPQQKSNDFTGIFEGKNVIFLQLEGMDSWLLTPEDTPTLYGMLDNSIEFTQHYSYYNGGGSTFNSELAVNTGFITPITYYQNAYTFSSNAYPYSLPRLFKAEGYAVNAFHMNTGEYYSRKLNYINWGYDQYYGLLDVATYNDNTYELDRELILNPTFREALFGQDGPFMHYLITFTPHTPFHVKHGKGKLLATERYGSEIPPHGEEETARLYASETDYMVRLLLEGLEECGHLDDTVIVVFADHYLYTLNDKTILEKYKQAENNLINHTPFFIWSSGMGPVKIDKVNSQIDILPTVLNMFGIDGLSNYTIGRDIMDEDYKGYVFFSDYSWYDGNIYVENGEVAMGTAPSAEYVKDMSGHITALIQQNDLIQKYDIMRTIPLPQ